MEILEFVFSPIVRLMEIVLNFLFALTGSMGLSILLLSFIFALVLLPIQRKGKRVEERVSEKISLIDKELKPLKTQYKGEQLFLETEKIYQKHNFHPIKGIATGTSFLVMLPVLISAILLLIDNSSLDGRSFLIIEDLSKPDQLFASVNLLPFVMSGVTLIDARLRYKEDKRSQVRFLFIAIVLLVLVYSMPAGLVLYWTGSNIFSLVSNNYKSG